MTGLAVRVLVVVVQSRRALEARAQPPRDVRRRVVRDAADAGQAVSTCCDDGPQAQALAERRDARVATPGPPWLRAHDAARVGAGALGVGLS